MRVSVFGLGYVGCVSATCLAQKGHQVFGIDVDLRKVELIRQGCAPVVEQGMDALVQDAVQNGGLQVECDARAAVHSSDLSMVCVGTPGNRNGSLNLRSAETVCLQIGAALADKVGYHVVAVRSTVLPGSTVDRLIPILEQHSGRHAGPDFGVCVNPEFLREGCAVADFHNPEMVVIGELDQRSGELVESLYGDICAPTVHTTIPVAEMIKYANNAFHALKVVFANEIGVLCKAHGIDGREVMGTLCRDKRLNVSAAYLRPGFAFGGSCLPKDLRALLYRAKERDIDCPVLRATLLSNEGHVQRAVDLIEGTGREKIGVLGLSFKPGTDDVRESPVISLVEMLIGKGYRVCIYDERVEPNKLTGTNKAFLEREIPHIVSLICSSLEEVLEWAEIVVVTHDDATFRRVPTLVREDQKLIDLVGLAESGEHMRGDYEGICW